MAGGGLRAFCSPSMIRTTKIYLQEKAMSMPSNWKWNEAKLSSSFTAPERCLLLSALSNRFLFFVCTIWCVFRCAPVCRLDRRSKWTIEACTSTGRQIEMWDAESSNDDSNRIVYVQTVNTDGAKQFSWNSESVSRHALIDTTRYGCCWWWCVVAVARVRTENSWRS